MKKYELTKNKKTVYGRVLYQIMSLKDFGDVKAGDLGGYIESERNLSQHDNCWVYEDACVMCNARVEDNARVYGEAMVVGDAWVFNNAQVFGNAFISGDAEISGAAKIFGNARIAEKTIVCDTASVSGNVLVKKSIVNSNSFLTGDLVVRGCH